MRLYTRLALLMVLLVLLPALPAVRMARELVTRSLNLGLSPDVDTALQAGVRQAREQFQRQRRDLADSLEVWVAGAGGRISASAEALMRAAAVPGGLQSPRPHAVPSSPERVALPRLPRPDVVPALPGCDAVLRLPNGTTRVLRGTAADTSAAALGDMPPRLLSVAKTLSDGSVLIIRRPMAEAWRSDAQALATSLQRLRGLRVERTELERGFWLPFLGLYAASVLAALLVAGWLARGLLVPVQRLVLATREVGAGNWSVRVPVSGRDEITRLSEQFNDMIRRLDAQSRRLVDLEKMAGWREMARALAHEVKNPLTPIQLTVEEMCERYRGEDREYAALLDKCSRIVVRQIESLRNVVTRFRDFARPVEPRFAPVDLNALAADVGALQRDLRVKLDLAPDLGSIRADDDRLRQLLMNLARNAQAATAGRESPCLRLATRAAGESVVLEVEDNGPGIPPEERERVFEPYRSGSAGGLGLGLALVKGIVLAHGGSVWVEDGSLGGACLHIELPRDPEAKHD
jgi:nitrogen fixation/metabolism regulation signal transduction histidine kinase